MGFSIFEDTVEDCSVEAAKTITVNDDGGANYTKIQDAIDNATAGDTIRVYAGTYFENIMINKSVNLVGNGSANTTIIGNNNSDVIRLTTNFVNVTGFKIINGTAGIRIEGGTGQRTRITGDGVERTVFASTTSNYFTSSGMSNNNGRKIATDSENLFVVYGRRTSSNTYQQIYCARSSNDGASWQETMVSTGSTYSNDYQYSPSIAVDGNKTIYVVWQGDISTSGSYDQISFAKSTDSGVTFSTPGRISTYVSGDYNYRPAIAVDTSNIIHVVWYGRVSTIGTANNVQYSYSTNDGTSWSARTLLTSSSSYYSYYPTIAVDNNDDIHVAWYGQTSTYSTARNIFYRKFTTSWGTTEAVTTDTSSSYYNADPCITTDNNNKPHITWRRRTPSTNNYYYIFHSDKTSPSWSTPVQVSTYNSHNSNPSISISADGTKHVVWNGRTTTSTTYYQTVHSSNSGSSWTTPVAITTGNVHHNYPNLLEPRPQIVSNKGYAVVYTKPGSYMDDIKYQGSTELEIGHAYTNNYIYNNTFIGNRIGIYIENSNDNVLVNNTYNSNTEFGIHLNGSVNNYLYNNTMFSCGVFINGEEKEYWNTHTIPENNTVNDKPLYYWKDVINGIIPTNAGEVILTNSKGVTVENQNASNGTVGIIVGFSNNCIIVNNTYNFNDIYGIYVHQSNSIMLLNNTCNSNMMTGIQISNSDNITLLSNSLNNNRMGINITEYSGNCYIINTTLMNSTTYDIRFANNSHATALNCTLNWSNINYLDPASNLTIQWYLHVNVTNETGAGVPNANIVIKDNYTNQIYSGNTDATGYCNWIPCSEYVENITGIIKVLTPHNISAGRTPYEETYADPEPVMNITKIVNIVLYPDVTPPDPPTDLVFNKVGGTYLNMSWTESNSHDLYGYNIHINDTGSSSTFHFIDSTDNCYYNATNLLEEVTYYFVITSFDDVPLNSTNLTGYNTTIDITPPEPPTSILFSEIGRWFFNLSWTPSTSADVIGYQIFINDTGTNISYHFFASTPNYYHNCTGLIEDTKYYFKVRAYDEVSLFSVFSNNISSSTLDLTPPQPPTSLLFTEINGTFLNLSWAESISSDVEGYRIYINNTGSSTNFHSFGSTQNTFYNVTGLLEETTYFFEVKAYDEVPWESSALIGNNTTIDITPPKVPTNLAIFRLAHDFINITWTPSTSTDVQGYEIYVNDTGSVTKFHLLDTTQNTFYNYSGLLEETTYCFNIRAYDEIPYYSTFSTTVSDITPDVTPPSPPTSLIINKFGGRYIELSWTASISTDVEGYEIYINDTGSSTNFHLLGSTQNTFYNATELFEETTYYFQIRAFDEVPLCSTFSNVAFATTPDITPPAPPTSLTFSAIGGTYLDLFWSGSISTDLEGYQIYVSDISSNFQFKYLATTTNCFFNYTGLTEETKYSFYVIAFDDVPLYSEISTIISATTLDITPPKPPNGLTAQDPTGHEITLTWNPFNVPDVIGYHVFINDTGTGSSGPFHKIDTIVGNFSQFTVRGLIEKTKYYFVITAFDERPNNSSYSNVASAVTLDKTAPQAPTGFTATPVSGTKIVLNWDPNPEQDLAGYYIYINDTNSNATGTFHIIHTMFGYDTTYTVTNLLEKTIYYFKLKAFDNVPNNSSFSKVTFTATLDETPPTRPTGLIISDPQLSELTISWAANPESDIMGYNLYRSLSPTGTFVTINSALITGTQYIDTGLDENTKYYYKIIAIDTTYLESEFSEMVFGITKIGPRPPEINEQPDDFNIFEDNSDDKHINLYEWFNDVNGETLNFRYEGSENIKVIIFEENGSVILRPKNGWSGKETLRFYADDGIFDEISDTITITVLPVNDPPWLPSIIKPKDGIIIDEGETLDFEGRCDDPDLYYGDNLTFTWHSNINGELGNGKILKNIDLDAGEHLITLDVTDTSGETSKAVIKVIVLESPDGRENLTFTALMIGSVGLFIIVIFLILILFMHFKKKKIPEGFEPSKNEIKPSIKDQLQPAHISPGSPSPTYQIYKIRQQDLPAFKCPSCGNAIYEQNKCLNCGWMGKST